jgi:hypothetical protein
MKLDYILIEEICLFKFNRDIDRPMRVNLRDAVINSEGNIVAMCEIGDGWSKTGRRGSMQDFFIHMDEYTRLLREKKLKDIGI